MERVSKFRVDDDWINCEMAYLKKRMKFDDSDAVLTTETSVPILFAMLEEIKERRDMIKALARRGDPGENVQVPKNEFGAPERVSDEWLAWAIGYRRNPVWILACLQELQDRREDEKHSTPKGRLERNIKGVFERDFNDLSIKQLGEIASIIMDCGECPIFDCVTSERCNVVFEDALREERRGEDGKSE